MFNLGEFIMFFLLNSFFSLSVLPPSWIAMPRVFPLQGREQLGFHHLLLPSVDLEEHSREGETYSSTPTTRGRKTSRRRWRKSLLFSRWPRVHQKRPLLSGVFTERGIVMDVGTASRKLFLLPPVFSPCESKLVDLLPSEKRHRGRAQPRHFWGILLYSLPCCPTTFSSSLQDWRTFGGRPSLVIPAGRFLDEREREKGFLSCA